jgi:alpha-beta hydrolase superfamily lysophospholipase
VRLFSLLIGFVFMTTTLSARGETPEPECVVLLHGIGLRGYVMKRLESALRQDGYRVVNLSYPSRKMSFEELVRDFLPARLRRHDTGRAPRLHFVTHSLGSLLVRSFLQQARPANLGQPGERAHLAAPLPR